MSVNINNFNAGQAYNNWTILASKTGEQTPDLVISTSNADSKEYLGDFVELTKSYIAEYDTDGDDAISFDEFKAKEIATAKDNEAIEPDETTLKLAFDRLNVVKEGEFGGKLSQKEIFSYFMGMDCLDNTDGKISYKEYAMMALSLQDTSTEKDTPGGMVSNYLKQTYDSIFGE